MLAKGQLLILFFSLCQLLSAQIFSEYPLRDPLVKPLISDKSSVILSDVDGDGDKDMLMKGFASNNVEFKLYINDGLGNFTEPIDMLFEHESVGLPAFLDVDGDNDNDLIIVGSASQLYLNDGQGNFIEAINSPFYNITNGSMAFSDVDNDNDNDVLITGLDGSSNLIAKLYLNDGQGNFVETLNNPFQGVAYGRIVFADVDGDGDQDVLISGSAFGPSSNDSKLYLNDGQGNFIEKENTPFLGAEENAVGFSDVDGDGDVDVIITGRGILTKMFLNDGQGNFTENPNTQFPRFTNGSVSFSDVDNDNDEDLILSGSLGNSSNTSTKLYTNDGQGNFTEILDTPFIGIDRGSIVFSDIDGDNDDDVILTGQLKDDLFEDRVSKIYINDGQGVFTELNYPPFFGVLLGSVAFADVDGDSDNDLMVTGTNGDNLNFISIAKLYLNDGNANYTEKATNIPGTSSNSLVFSDVDGDNDQDVLMSGNNSSLRTTLYLNNGQGDFIESTFSLETVINSSIAFSDIDGDSDNDLLITGRSQSGEISKLYINNGQGNFTEKIGIPFEGVANSSIGFSDVDRDGDKDVLITGSNSLNGHSSKLYINDGEGNFTEVLNTPFMGVRFSSIAFSDVDGDYDEDVLITGSTNNTNSGIISKFYKNDGQGNFTEALDVPFEGVTHGSTTFADVDGDGDNDVLITGLNSSDNKISKLYINDGKGVFSEILDLPFEGVWRSSVAFSDADGDNDLDVFICGENNSGDPISKLYINQFSPSNSEISGFCYFDLNENQIKDTDEITLSNQLIEISPNATFNYPTINGQYRFFVDSGDYQLAAIPNELWQLTSDTIVEITQQGQPINNVNFGFIPTTEVSLIEPDIFSGPTRCSFDVSFWLSYQNNGTTFENGYLEFMLTEGAILLETSLQPDEIVGDKLYWDFANFAPSEIEKIRLRLKMPDASNIGDTLNFVATSFLTDNNQNFIQNTVYNYNPVLNCAYDPNDKAVTPVGVREDHLTLFDSEFEYKIRFQNTGTDTAFTVRIKDDLDPNLNWNTFKPISASHPYEVNMDSESGRVTFLFKNILLPDSTTNEPLSHGFVKYKILPLSNLSEETKITNEAGIFFDFNEPILTNMTLNTMVSTIPNLTENILSAELKTIPNPFQKSTVFKIREIPGESGIFNIYDTNGALVFSQSVFSNTNVTFRNDNLGSGIYFYEVVDQKGKRVFRGKVIKN